MNKDKIKQRLIIDEGKRNVVYKDKFGYLTIGIGHLVLKKDGLFLNDTITEDKIDELFDRDYYEAVNSLYEVFSKMFVWSLPENKQEVLVNLMFNLGITKFKKFKKFIKAIIWLEFNTAVKELKNSLWYTQVQKTRSDYIINNIGE